MQDFDRYVEALKRSKYRYQDGALYYRNAEISRIKIFDWILSIDPNANVIEVHKALLEYLEERSAKAKGMRDREVTSLHEAVRAYIEEYEITPTATGSWRGRISDLSTLNGFIVELNEQARRQANQIFHETGEKVKPLILSKFDAKDLLETSIARGAVKRFKAIQERLRYRQEYYRSSQRELSRLCRMLADADGHAVETKLVIYQFMWNVKRKLFGKEAKDHIVPYLYSPQGCGKSTLIRLFAEPLEELAMETDLEKLTDRFANRILESFFFVHLEESAKAGKSSIECVKSLISQGHTANRDMHSQLAKHRRVNISPIITSNNPLKQMFKDFTGMRRFYEIRHGMLDFDLVNDLDYLAMWIGVDENVDESPFRRSREVYARIVARQEEYRSENTVELFLKENGYLPYTLQKSEWFTQKELFARFRRWADDNCDRKADIQSFLAQMGYLHPRVLSRKYKNRIEYLLNRDGGSAAVLDPDDEIAATENKQSWEDLE